MTSTDDFCPLVEQGEVPTGGGLIGRVRRREDLAPLEAGFARVLLAADGSPVPPGQRSAGEKRWGAARSWVKVDISHHTLEYAIPFSDPTGRVSFTARVGVRAAVGDPSEVARQGIVSVKDFLRPAVGQVVVEASGAIESQRDPDPIIALADTRKRADAAVRNAVRGPVVTAPRWLVADFVSVSVGFDAATERHHAELIESARTGEMIVANQANDAKRAEANLAVRAIWRKELLPHLSDPAARIFEVAFADPTRQNLANAVDQVTSSELQYMLQGFEVLRTMVDKDFVDKDDPVYAAIQAMSGKLAHVYLPGAAAALSSPAAAGGLGAGDAADEHAHEGEAVDLDRREGEDAPGDRDWGDD